MKITRSWLLPIALWAYFITAYVLYAYFNIAWVNTFDLLLGLVLTLAFSVWYVIDRFKYRDPSKPRKPGWYIDSYGNFRRRRAKPLAEQSSGSETQTSPLK